jgi:hypothetical protein
MPDATFKKVGNSGTPMYGPKRLIVCGYVPEAQETLLALLSHQGFGKIPIIFVTDETAALSLKEILNLPPMTGRGSKTTMKKAVIMSGFTEKELRNLLAAFRSSPLSRPFFATLTPVSEGWSHRRLLNELSKEANMMAQRGRPLEKTP